MSGKLYTQFYRDLYALQDRVFKVVEEYDYYLTGGTALSRFYLNHRFSEDLDFFIHKKQNFLTEVQEIIAKLKTHFTLETLVLTQDFAQIFLHTEKFSKNYGENFQAKLKVDFVNELEIPRFGELKPFQAFSRVDNLQNILSNKITAITRLEPKDIADIWFICKNYSFKWNEIIYEADQKEAIEELLVFDLLKTFPVKMFDKIRWIDRISTEEFERDRQIILQDLLTKQSNSLVRNP